jgi:hypothetical protein
MIIRVIECPCAPDASRAQRTPRAIVVISPVTALTTSTPLPPQRTRRAEVTELQQRSAIRRPVGPAVTGRSLCRISSNSDATACDRNAVRSRANRHHPHTGTIRASAFHLQSRVPPFDCRHQVARGEGGRAGWADGSDTVPANRQTHARVTSGSDSLPRLWWPAIWRRTRMTFLGG